MTPKIATRMKAVVLEQDRAQMQKTIDALRYDLSQRHTMAEDYAELVKEKNILEDLVVSTQSENERCEEELKKWKAYAKELEKKIESYEGPNWQEGTGVPSTPAAIKAFRKPIGSTRTIVPRLELLQPRPDMQSSRDHTGKPTTTLLPVESDETSTGIHHEPATQAVDSEITEPMIMPRRRRQAVRGANYRDYPTSQPHPPRAARYGLGQQLVKPTVVDHEEQVVPALVNASKREQRRRSLLGDAPAMLAGWAGLDLKVKAGGREDEGGQEVFAKADIKTYGEDSTADTPLPDLGSMENLISESPSTESQPANIKFDAPSILAAEFPNRERMGRREERAYIARRAELEKLEGNVSDSMQADDWQDDGESMTESIRDYLAERFPEVAKLEAREFDIAPDFEGPQRLAIILSNFNHQHRAILKGLTATVHRAEETGKTEQSNRLNLMRTQGKIRAEAIQQISDMADDVKSHVADMESQAEEREKRLMEMLETALAHAELYSPSPTADLQQGVNLADANPGQQYTPAQARVTT